MPKVNYKFNKRQKEIAKKKKRAEKLRRKQENKDNPTTEIPIVSTIEDAPVEEMPTEDVPAEKHQEVPES